MLRNLALIGWAGGSTTAWAQNVDNLDQGTSYVTIQDAIDDASPGDTLELVAASFNEEVSVDRDVVVFGDGTTTLSSPGVAMFDLAAGVSFDLSGVVVEPVLGDVDLRGIIAELGGNTITLSDSSFTISDPLANGSALLGTDTGPVTLTNVAIHNAVPGTDSAYFGGAIYIDNRSSATFPISLTDVLFDRTQGFINGAIEVYNGDVTCTRCAVDHVVGGGVTVAAGGSLLVDQSTFCGVDGEAIGTGFIGPFVLHASRFTEGTTEYAVVSSGQTSSTSITNNLFVGTTGSPDAPTLDVYGSGTVDNNLFYENAGYAIHLSGDASVTHNWFEANAAGDITGGSLDATNLSGPPQVASWTVNGDCSDDQLWPLPLSVGGLIDAGDPAILDPDGSRSDIGAYGGPFADPAIHSDGDGDGFLFLHDCDDTNGGAFPGAIEICNGFDDDCNGLVDEADPAVVGTDTFFQDCDDDGQGDPLQSVVACFIPTTGCANWASEDALGSLASADCDDADPLAYLGADELCAAGDQNCDGDADLNAIDATPYYVDDDQDGFGSDVSVMVCGETAPDGYSTTTGDCVDGDPSFYPGALDPCGDGLDQDCNLHDGDDASLQDWYPDTDSDGFGDPGGAAVVDCAEDRPGYSTYPTDCDDTDGAVHPGALEQCNAIDDDCAGGVDDGLTDCDTDDSPAPDADDEPSDIHPAACSCATRSSAGSPLLALAVLVAARRRRYFATA